MTAPARLDFDLQQVGKDLVDLRIVQGADHVQPFAMTDENGDPDPLTDADHGAVVEIQTHVRENIGDPDPPLSDWSLTGGQYVITDDAGGLWQLQLTAAETSAITWERALYDTKITYADGFVRFVLEGRVVVNQRVTV